VHEVSDREEINGYVSVNNIHKPLIDFTIQVLFFSSCLTGGPSQCPGDRSDRSIFPPQIIGDVPDIRPFNLLLLDPVGGHGAYRWVVRLFESTTHF
jgi:hypothetical protein